MLTVIVVLKEEIDTPELKYKGSKSNLILVYSNSTLAFYVEEHR